MRDLVQPVQEESQAKPETDLNTPVEGGDETVDIGNAREHSDA
jgi:hypothetical protein